MKHTEKECKGIHCRCMSGDCPNQHYADHVQANGLTPMEEKQRVAMKSTEKNTVCCDSCWAEGAKKKDLHGHYFCKNYHCPCHSDIEKPSTVEVGHAKSKDNLIDGIIDEWMTQPRTMSHSTQEAWLRQALTKAEEAGREEGENATLNADIEDYPTRADRIAKEQGRAEALRECTKAFEEGRAEFARVLLEKIHALPMKSPEVESDHYDLGLTHQKANVLRIIESELKRL